MKKSQLPVWIFLIGWVCSSPSVSMAAEWKDKAEAEGKLVFYTTANTADTKALTDSFKKIYPKIEVQFERTTDSQMMEKILIESRAGKPLWDVVLRLPAQETRTSGRLRFTGTEIFPRGFQRSPGILDFQLYNLRHFWFQH